MPVAGPITIAAAQAEDVPALQSTASASWWATYGSYLSASFIQSFLERAYSTSRLLAHLSDPQSYFAVVKSGETLIGFGQVGPTMPRRDKVPAAPADLYRLYLLPEWQRKGIGSKLLAELEAWLRRQGYPTYGAYVHERNEPAQQFYLRHGFTRRPECDLHEQNEWYLVKQLDR